VSCMYLAHDEPESFKIVITIGIIDVIVVIVHLWHLVQTPGSQHSL